MQSTLNNWLPLLVLDLVLFKVIWLLLVALQAGATGYGALLILLRFAVQTDLKNRLLPTALVFFTGLSMDLVLTAAGLYEFARVFLPTWLVLVWLNFALSVPGSLSFLLAWHPGWLSLTGMVTGSLAYLAGYLFDAVTFGLPLVPALLVIALAWSVYLPLLVNLLNRLPRQGDWS